MISVWDVESIYQIPRMLFEQGVDRCLTDLLRIDAPQADLSVWDRLVAAHQAPRGEVRIAMVGKYVDLTESYKSLSEALSHAGMHTECRVRIDYIDSETITDATVGALSAYAAVLVPGGFGKRGVEGKIRAIRYVREQGIPFLGICLGLQLAVIEYARHCCDLPGANSTEFEPDTQHPVVGLLSEWRDREGQLERRSSDSDLGGTMRLGAQRCPVRPHTRAWEIYGSSVNERHRHRYEVNNHYREKLESAGLVISAATPQEQLAEIVELPDAIHPWFVAVQFHPEFTSTPRDGHPLFSAYLRAAMRQRPPGAHHG